LIIFPKHKFKLKKSYFQIISTFFRLPLFAKFEFDRTDNQPWKKFVKAKFLQLKLLQIFARDIFLMKKLEIEKTKPTFIISVLKVEY